MSNQPHETRSAAYRFRVEGTDGFARASSVKLYDETFAVEAEHPVEALEKLLHEVEWSVLDPERGFTVTYLADDAEFDDLVRSVPEQTGGGFARG